MPGSLWDFSLKTYRRPGVQDACLKLQDELGADVNMLLYCCWRGAIEAGEMAALLAELAPWQTDIVGGLRSVRRALKPMLAELDVLFEPASSLRKKIAALELEAEKLQQDMLARHAAKDAKSTPSSPHTAVRNLTRYIGVLAAAPNESQQHALGTLIGAAFADGNQTEIKEALKNLIRPPVG
jgi:uncharacterized protein (TIGR02444 family)